MDEAKVARIDQSKLRESVYEALCDAFTRGAFAPGEVVSLRTLADQLGTSLTPVREAVRRLVAEGALVDTPSRTLAVAPFDAGRMEELKAARLALEALLLDRAAARIGAGTLAKLEDLIATPGQRGGQPDLQLNHDFHFTLYGAAGSDVILPVVRALWLQYGAYLHLVVQTQAAASVAEHEFHQRIVSALKTGDIAAAQAALRADIERSFGLLGERDG
ncbi:MAG: GntR family transcriptional regulator [Pseudomonadota bacterium]